VLPPAWSAAIAIHFAHRVGAAIVTGAIIATATHVLRHHRGRPELARPAMLLVVLVLTQATLGALVVLSGLQPFINTLHVVNGALVLGTSLVLTLRGFRPVIVAHTADGLVRARGAGFDVRRVPARDGVRS
jgi:cytochrome c oxidase assembly protein subunit 15